MVAWRYETFLLVLKNISTLEDKSRISARPCNMLYIFLMISFVNRALESSILYTIINNAYNHDSKLTLTKCKASKRGDYYKVLMWPNVV